MGLKPSPSGETFRFYYCKVRAAKRNAPVSIIGKFGALRYRCTHPVELISRAWNLPASSRLLFSLLARAKTWQNKWRTSSLAQHVSFSICWRKRERRHCWNSSLSGKHHTRLIESVCGPPGITRRRAAV